MGPRRARNLRRRSSCTGRFRPRSRIQAGQATAYVGATRVEVVPAVVRKTVRSRSASMPTTRVRARPAGHRARRAAAAPRPRGPARHTPPSGWKCIRSPRSTAMPQTGPGAATCTRSSARLSNGANGGSLAQSPSGCAIETVVARSACISSVRFAANPLGSVRRGSRPYTAKDAGKPTMIRVNPATLSAQLVPEHAIGPR